MSDASSETIPEKAKAEASPMANACPTCGDANTRPCHAVFNSETKTTDSSTHGGGVAFGPGGKLTPVLASASTSGVQQTNLAKMCAPPEKESPVSAFFGGLVLGGIIAAIGAGIAGYFFDSATAAGWTAAILFALFIAVAVAMTKEAMQKNRDVFPKVFELWQHRWVCLRCHHMFAPATAGAVVPVPAPTASSNPVPVDAAVAAPGVVPVVPVATAPKPEPAPAPPKPLSKVNYCLECGKKMGFLTIDCTKAMHIGNPFYVVCSTCALGVRRWKCGKCAKEFVAKKSGLGYQGKCPSCKTMNHPIEVPKELQGKPEAVEAWKRELEPKSAATGATSAGAASSSGATSTGDAPPSLQINTTMSLRRVFKIVVFVIGGLALALCVLVLLVALFSKGQ
jgi:hypothetical protein